MTTKINGRTPEEIKKGLECCIEPSCPQDHQCPYDDDPCCGGQSKADALAYIQQLERERDAAVEDARRSNNCKICKHNKKWGGDCEGWSLCGYNMPNWQWRGVQEVE